MSPSFHKSERLTGSKNISRLFTDGKSSFLHPFKLLFLEDEALSTCRFMVTVPKRNFKKAVDRNLLKRRIREAYRLNKHHLVNKKYDLAFIYIEKEILNYSVIEEKLLELLLRLK